MTPSPVWSRIRNGATRSSLFGTFVFKECRPAKVQTKINTKKQDLGVKLVLKECEQSKQKKPHIRTKESPR